MAKQMPVIVYYLNGKQYMRSKPAKVKQTKSTKQAGKSFGKASSLASQLVGTFKPLVPFCENREPYHGLCTSLVKWVSAEKTNPNKPNKDSILLKGLRFVKESSVESRFLAGWEITYTANGNVQIHIPAFAAKDGIYAPPGCKTIELKMMAINCKPYTGEIKTQAMESLVIPNNKTIQPATDIHLAITASAESLTLVALALKYDNINWSAASKKADRRWMPAGIVSSMWQ
jgi:hypothetical protein